MRKPEKRPSTDIARAGSAPCASHGVRNERTSRAPLAVPADSAVAGLMTCWRVSKPWIPLTVTDVASALRLEI
jgi:hypothetical protein